jgi:hypothetical protein
MQQTEREVPNVTEQTCKKNMSRCQKDPILKNDEVLHVDKFQGVSRTSKLRHSLT